MAPREFASRRHIEVRKVEARCDGATTQREAFADDPRGLQRARGDDPLRAFAGEQAWTELDSTMVSGAIDGVKFESRARVVVPDFIAQHAVKGRELARAEQKIDGRGRGA